MATLVTLADGVPWTVPVGVTRVTPKVRGGSGSGPSGYATFVTGAAGVAIGTILVSPGDVLLAKLGANGTVSAGGAPDGKAGASNSGGGGGRTELWVNGVLRMIGAGGAGAPYPYSSATNFSSGQGATPAGGALPNGGPNGMAGWDGSGMPTGGPGATQDADGADGTGGGGGGGGLHRGGNGATGKSGGGGSCWVDPALTAVSFTTTYAAGGAADVSYDPDPLPPAPTIVSPVAGGSARAGVVTLSWQHGGIDAQWAADVEYRLSGSGTSTPISITDGSQSTTVTLSPGAYEWRVRSYGQAQVAGSWSPWTPFNVETAPAAPVITAPADGATLTDVPVPIAWTGTGTAWQAQVVGPSGVLWDSGTVAGTDTSTVGQATVNNVTVAVRVRIKATYVYSDWAQVTCPVAWIGPVAPVVQTRSDPDTGSIGVEWTQPAGTPAVDHYEIVAVEDGVSFPAPGGSALGSALRSFVFQIPRSDVETRMQVLAVASSGAKTIAEAG